MADPPPPPPPASPPTPFSTSLSGAQLLIFIQVLSRALTFAANQFLLRFLSPELLGVSVQLDLLNTSILYFSRESFRNAIQRSSSPSPSTPISLLSLPLGLLISAILTPLYIRSASSELVDLPNFTLSVGIYVLATLVELLSEPFSANAQLKLDYRLRVQAESLAAVARTAGVCAATVYLSRSPAGPLPFAYGQLSYAIALLAVYVIRTPRPLPALTFSSPSDLPTLWAQNALKHLLTSADTLIASALVSPHDQGVFALASAYGSLLARLLFQPVEETLRNSFARLSLAQARSILFKTLRAYLLLSLAVLALGPPFIPSALRILAGSRWADKPDAIRTLQAWCYYVPVLAANGVLEAYVAVFASKRKLGEQSGVMIIGTGAFGAATWMAMRSGLGPTGLVVGNAVSMGVRIAWCGRFVGKGGWGEVVPGALTVLVTGVVRKVAEKMVGRNGLIGDIALGAGLAIVWAGVAAWVERRGWGELVSGVKGRRVETKKKGTKEL